MILVWTVHRFPDFTWVKGVTGFSPYGLIEWVSEKVFKSLVVGWRKVYKEGNGCWKSFSIIPNLLHPENNADLTELLKVIGIPEGNKWDILRFAPKWPSIVAGGPHFLHSARAFQNSLLPMLRAIDAEVWPLAQTDQLLIWQYGIVAKPDEYPVDPPGNTGHWIGNPGADNPITENYSLLTREFFKRTAVSLRGVRALILEYAHLFPRLGKDLLLFFEANPKQFIAIVGQRRFRVVITEMRELLLQLDSYPIRQEGWRDPFNAILWVQHAKVRAASFLERRVVELRAAQDKTSTNLAAAERALAQARSPHTRQVGTSSWIRRWNEPQGRIEMPGMRRAFGDDDGYGRPADMAERMGDVQEVAGDSAPKRRKPWEGDSHFDEDIELFIDQCEMEEFGPA